MCGMIDLEKRRASGGWLSEEVTDIAASSDLTRENTALTARVTALEERIDALHRAVTGLLFLPRRSRRLRPYLIQIADSLATFQLDRQNAEMP